MASIGELSVIVKALAVSSPFGNLTVEQLESDFLLTEGYNFPFCQFGFESVDHLLRQGLKNVVNVYGYGSKAIVEPITDERTKHIQKLIKEQSHRKKKKSQKKAQHFSRNSDLKVYDTEKTNRFYNSQKLNNAIQREYESNADAKPRSNLENKTDNHKDEVSKIAGDDRIKALQVLQLYQEEIFSETTEQHQETTNIYENQYEHDRLITQTEENSNSNIDVHILKENSVEIKENKNIHKDAETSLSEISDCSTIIAQTSLVKSEESVHKNIDCSIKAEEDKEEAIPHFAINKSVFSLDFPENTLRFGQKIKTLEIPQNIQIDSIISIYITEVHNPYRFWFNLNSEISYMDDLMLNIERFFKHQDVQFAYTITPELIQIGQVCVTLFNNFWHRAEIISNIVEGKVKVFFMDYGTVYSVSIEDVKYLPNELGQLPAFAMRGSLGEINPVRLHWSVEATSAMITMSFDRLLHAQVCEIDTINRVFYLKICDTHDVEVIHLNRELIEMQLALKSSNWESSKKYGIKRLRHIREDYPTFDMLEAGDYPTVAEIYYLNSIGIDYESITDKIIYPYEMEKTASKVLRELPFYLLANNPFKADIERDLQINIEENTNQTGKLKI